MAILTVLGVKIEEIAGNYYYAEGAEAGKAANVYKCCSCNKWVSPIFKGVPWDVDSYIYPECDVCHEVVCLKCGEDDLHPGTLT